MKTYLVVWFSSEGTKPSAVTERLLSMGFKPIEGNYDYVYNWDNAASLEEILRIGDQIQAALSDTKVLFKLETV